MSLFLRGALAGLLATVPMTFVMTAMFRRLPRSQQYPLPPVLITARMVELAGAGPVRRGPALAAGTLGTHFLYGAATGMAYPMIVSPQRTPMLAGPLYGLAVWTLSYLGWIPAARILTPATRHPLQRNLLMWCAHVVWGASLAGFARLLVQDRDRELSPPAPVDERALQLACMPQLVPQTPSLQTPSLQTPT